MADSKDKEEENPKPKVKIKISSPSPSISSIKEAEERDSDTPTYFPIPKEKAKAKQPCQCGSAPNAPRVIDDTNQNFLDFVTSKSILNFLFETDTVCCDKEEFKNCKSSWSSLASHAVNMVSSAGSLISGLLLGTDAECCSDTSVEESTGKRSSTNVEESNGQGSKTNVEKFNGKVSKPNVEEYKGKGFKTNVEYKGRVFNPNVEEYKGRESKPNVEEYKGKGSKPNVEKFNGKGYKPNVEEYKGRGSKPNIVEYKGRGFKPNVEEYKRRGSKPNVVQYKGKGSNPNVEEYKGKGSNPNVMEYRGKGSNPNDEESRGRGSKTNVEKYNGKGSKTKDEESKGEGSKTKEKRDKQENSSRGLPTEDKAVTKNEGNTETKVRKNMKNNAVSSSTSFVSEMEPRSNGMIYNKGGESEDFVKVIKPGPSDSSLVSESASLDFGPQHGGIKSMISYTYKITEEEIPIDITTGDSNKSSVGKSTTKLLEVKIPQFKSSPTTAMTSKDEKRDPGKHRQGLMKSQEEPMKVEEFDNDPELLVYYKKIEDLEQELESVAQSFANIVGETARKNKEKETKPESIPNGISPQTHAVSISSVSPAPSNLEAGDRSLNLKYSTRSRK